MFFCFFQHRQINISVALSSPRANSWDWTHFRSSIFPLCVHCCHLWLFPRDFNWNWKIKSNKNEPNVQNFKHLLSISFFFLTAFSQGGKMLEPIPSICWWRQDTSLNESPAHRRALFGVSVPCSRIPQKRPEGVLAPLLLPAHLPTVVCNQEPSVSQPSPKNWAPFDYPTPAVRFFAFSTVNNIIDVLTLQLFN